MNNTPIISIIGTTNIGKSSTIASLCDLAGADKPAIEAEGGTTRQTQSFGICYSDTPGIRYVTFQDTPGFQRCGDLQKRVSEYCRENNTRDIPLSEVVRFCEQAAEEAGKENNPAKAQDCTDDWVAWGTILETHLTLFVVDAQNSPDGRSSSETRHAFDILKACGTPVMTVFNFVDQGREQAQANIKAWRQWLTAKGFHCALEYDAITRDYQRGIKLLEEIERHPIFNDNQKQCLQQAIVERKMLENRKIARCRKTIAESLLNIAALRFEEHYVSNGDGVQTAKRRLNTEFFSKVAQLALKAECELVEHWDFPQQIIVKTGTHKHVYDEYLTDLRERFSAADWYGNVTFDGPNTTVTPYWLFSSSTVSVRAVPDDFNCLLARLCAVVAALRIRGHAQDDRSPLDVKSFKTSLPDEIRTFFTNNAYLLSIESKREKLVIQLADLLQTHYSPLKRVT